MGHDVFISYSSHDKVAADAVCAALESNGIRCWIAPRDIKAGENWATAILNAIVSCRLMVLVFSSHTNGSQHIRREVERAVNRGIPIAPIRIQDAMPKDALEYFLSSSHWMDALTPPLEGHLRTFAANVRGLLTAAGASPPAPPELSTRDQPRPFAASAGAGASPGSRRNQRVGVSMAALLLICIAVAGWALRARSARLRADEHRGGSAGSPAPAASDENAIRNAAARRVQLTYLLQQARACNIDDAEKGIAVLTEALKLDPANAEALTLRKTFEDYLASHVANTLGMKFLRIEPGEFDMGSPAGEEGRFDDETLHHVKLTRPFLMGIHPVTRGQFAAYITATGRKTDAEIQGKAVALSGAKFVDVAGTSWRNPGFDQADDHPVVEVSWNDATAFCDWLSEKERKHYRLPTEAQWEYACRAGSATAYFWGDDPDAGQGYANCADLTAGERFPDWRPVFGFRDGFVFTSPVGSFKPNKFGLCDMIGNAWQWCSDTYGDYGSGPLTDPTGAMRGEERILRGGGWVASQRLCRCAYRMRLAADDQDYASGFRISLDCD